nr:dihydroorotate dehydrogenase electron transfer subunit [Clostridium fermenticellae]
MVLNFSTSLVYENVEVFKNIFKLSIRGKFGGRAGQFYMLRAWGDYPVLSRPISIHFVSDKKIVFLYQNVGEGTKILSRLKKGDPIQITGPLGNGFDIQKINGKAALISGGIGIAPMLQLVRELKDSGSIDIYSGFKDEFYEIKDLKDYVDNINISTETGTYGHKGYITEIFKPELYDVVICCGPEIMMSKVIKMCREKSIPVYVSMEKHMACGVGACLVCTCKTKDGNKRTCKDGPVFFGDDLILKEE